MSTGKVYVIVQKVDDEELVVGSKKKLYTDYNEALTAYVYIAKKWYKEALVVYDNCGVRPLWTYNPPMLKEMTENKVVLPSSDNFDKIHELYKNTKSEKQALQKKIENLEESFHNGVVSMIS